MLRRAAGQFTQSYHAVPYSTAPAHAWLARTWLATAAIPAAVAGDGRFPAALAGSALGMLASVGTARIGNRLLQRFFVSIDYGRRLVGLWNDPRVPAS